MRKIGTATGKKARGSGTEGNTRAGHQNLMNLPLKPLANPIMLISDSPGQPTGLARLCRDLATLVSAMPEFRVAVLGRTPYTGIDSRHFPWKSYPFPEAGQWGQDYILPAWKDFAGTDAGIIMTLWDLSRTLWMSRPQGMKEDIEKFLGPGRNYAKWAYVPVDATGPDEHGLPVGMVEAARGYERVCAASEWGANVVRRHRPSNWVPHPIHTDVFKPANTRLIWDRDLLVLGCNMTNQARKDWPVAFETAKILRADFGNRFKFWAHTDMMIGYWNLFALATDYGVGDCIEVTLDLTDEQLAQRYSECACTILPSACEGFGFPIAESMSCGTPCVVTDYAAGQELVPDNCKVSPVAYKIETQHDVRHAVLSGWGFASRAKAQIEKRVEDWDYTAAQIRESVSHLEFTKLQHVWRRWFLEGIGLA